MLSTIYLKATDLKVKKQNQLAVSQSLLYDTSCNFSDIWNPTASIKPYDAIKQCLNKEKNVIMPFIISKCGPSVSYIRNDGALQKVVRSISAAPEIAPVGSRAKALTFKCCFIRKVALDKSIRLILIICRFSLHIQS